MVRRSLKISLGVTLLALPLALQAARYDRPINVITSDYDLVDTTYIDRGRLDGVKVGDHFQIKERGGKAAAQVVVTGVFERMASVKISDQWALKEGQFGGFEQRPMIVALQAKARRAAPALEPMTAKKKEDAKPDTSPAPVAPVAPAVAPAAPATPAAAALPLDPMADPMLDAGLPENPGAAAALPTDPGMPGAEALPTTPAAPAVLPTDPGLPDPAGDMGLPTDPATPAAPAIDAGIPPPPGEPELPLP